MAPPMMAIEVNRASLHRAMTISERNHRRAPAMAIPVDPLLHRCGAHQTAGAPIHQPAGARTATGVEKVNPPFEVKICGVVSTPPVIVSKSERPAGAAVPSNPEIVPPTV